MPEPEHSIEELVEDHRRALKRYYEGDGLLGVGDVAGTHDTLLRAVARLREENTGLRALAEAQRGHIEIINAAFERVARESERLRGLLAEAHPALHEACQGSMCCPDGCLADKVRSALTPKGGDRDR